MEKIDPIFLLNEVLFYCQEEFYERNEKIWTIELGYMHYWLFVIKKDKSKQTNEWMSTNTLFKSSKFMIPIFQKLLKDGYIDVFVDGNKINIDDVISKEFSIKMTFEGLLFCKEGGYKGKFERDNSRTFRDTTIAIAVAFATVGIFILEILKIIYPSTFSK